MLKKGNSPEIIQENIRNLIKSGKSQEEALKSALRLSQIPKRPSKFRGKNK